MNYEIICSSCNKPAESLLAFKCSSCGNPLSVHLHDKFDPAKIRKKDYSGWRYAESFPYTSKTEIITLGEGWTPLVRFAKNIYFKLESSNPTGSFKDRGSTALISAIHKQIKKTKGHITEDSSGNAGASIAAYASRAGLKARIYVPENVSGPKFSQIQFYGAEVTKVSGSRSHVAEAAQKATEKGFYVGHILHPLFRDGVRSLAYELAEQFTWNMPERIYLPVSAGTLLLGIIEGFKHLYASKAIRYMPKIVACQTEQVSPLYNRFRKLPYEPPPTLNSVADALVSVNPPLLDLMVKGLREVEGATVIVKEKEIYSAFLRLAKNGFFVEPSSAVAFAGFMQQTDKKELEEHEKAVIILTGTGLKTSLQPR
ncbi:MAG: pyridoxal-phosphate dependent enzyme [Candidatus Bathyarchaeota archaeon]|nr:pyridoxal-phosphate dependent enzyme [Candidatus Bathyarchaeota archaeon]